MSINNPIGGFLGLECSSSYQIRWAHAVNSGRSGLELILRHYKPSKLYVPALICPCVPEFLKSVGQNFDTYHVNEQLELEQPIDVKHREMLLYVNYFGIKDAYCDELQKQYGMSLILDLTQAFFYQSYVKCPSFSSVRKLFGVPDGGFVTNVPQEMIDALPVANGAEHSSHLVLRADGCLDKAYAIFKENEKRFDTEHPMQMSRLSNKILNCVDFSRIHQKRHENFRFLDNALKEINELTLVSPIPLSYPLLLENGEDIRNYLIANNIFIPKYWSGIQKLSSVENNLAKNIIHIPIDQRYGLDYMERILTCLGERNGVYPPPFDTSRIEKLLSLLFASVAA